MPSALWSSLATAEIPAGRSRECLNFSLGYTAPMCRPSALAHWQAWLDAAALLIRPCPAAARQAWPANRRIVRFAEEDPRLIRAPSGEDP